MPETWIGVTDSRPTPLLNSLLATIESGYLPDEILIFASVDDEHALDSIRKLVEGACEQYDIDPQLDFSTTPSISKPKEISEHIVKTVQELGDDGSKAVSISSGSRLLVSCLIGAIAKPDLDLHVDHVYTLEGRDQAKLETTYYPMIPRPEMELVDFQENSAPPLSSPRDHKSTDTAYKITRHQLPILFNALYSIGDRSLSVDHKSDDISTLYKIELERGEPARIRFSNGVDEYERERSQVERLHGEQAHSELPDGRSFVGAFTASVLEFENQDEISEQVDPYRNRRLEHGNAASLAVFDTNLIQYWPGHQLGVAPELENGLNGYAVVTGVRDELMNFEGNPKIQSTHDLEEAFGREYSELYNQPKQTPRQLHIGRQYFNRLRRKLYTEKIRSDTGDNNITAACENFHQTGGFDLLLFSNDAGFISAARAREIPAILVDLPDTFPRTMKVNWEDAATALYLHTVQFGTLELPKIDLYGVWPRKRPHDWETDTLAVRCRSPVAEKQFDRYMTLMDERSQFQP